MKTQSHSFSVIKRYGLRACSVLLSASFCVSTVFAQVAPPKPGTDVLIFANGEKLVGHLVSATGPKITFHSDMAGDVTAPWSKVKELHSSGKFAVAETGVLLGRHADLSKVPQGTVAAEDQKIQVDPGNGAAAQTVPVAQAANVIPEDSFLGAFRKPKFTDFWHGTASLGAALVAATQDSRSLSTAVTLSRTVPNETWADPRYRTTFDFSSAYGELTQPGTPTVKTDIIHADVEQDEYFSQKLYGFGNAAFDHSISQGLSLEQTYGGGIGYTVFKTAIQELDLKAEVAYIKYAYEPVVEADGTKMTPPDKDLIGAVITQIYNRSFKRGITLHESLSITPAFNDNSAYSALGTVNLSIPVFKKLSFTIGTSDSYLNDPPVGFKKNSFQFTTNLTYAIN